MSALLVFVPRVGREGLELWGSTMWKGPDLWRGPALLHVIQPVSSGPREYAGGRFFLPIAMGTSAL